MRAPRNKSLKASSRCPSFRRASASVTSRTLALPSSVSPHRRPRARHPEGQQHAVEARGIRVDAHQRLAAHVLGHVGHQPVLPHRHHHLLAGEEEGGHQRAIHLLHRQPQRQRAVQHVQRPAVGVVLARVVLEVLPGVLQVEARLGPGVQPLHQLRQPRLAGDEDDLLEHGALTGCPGALLPRLGGGSRCVGPSSPLSSSGDMFSSPIFPAFSAISRKARAMFSFGSSPPPLAAMSVFQSIPRTGASTFSRA